MLVLLSVVSLLSATVASRNEEEGAAPTKTPSKCTIKWHHKYEANDPQAPQPSKVWFPVTSCMKCKATFTDYFYDKEFTAAFVPYQDPARPRKCICNTKNGDFVTKIAGACGDDVRAAQKRCWESYRKETTDKLVCQGGVCVSKGQPDFYHKSDRFDYGDCEPEACPEGVDCKGAELNTVWETYTAKEKEQVAGLVTRALKGKKDAIKSQERRIVAQLGREEIDAAVALAKQMGLLSQEVPDTADLEVKFDSLVGSTPNSTPNSSPNTPNFSPESSPERNDSMNAWKQKAREIFDSIAGVTDATSCTADDINAYYTEALAGTAVRFDKLLELKGIGLGDTPVSFDEFLAILAPEC